MAFDQLKAKLSHVPGIAPEYRAYVGPPRNYDLAAANQFSLLTLLGLREFHSLLDIGCGSLRGGRLFIPYLLPGRYHGIEPNQSLVEEGIKNELGEDIIRIKQPVFNHDGNFTLTVFNRKFDFLLAQSIFTHASEQQIRRCLSEAKKVMQPSSIFVANFFTGEQNYTGDEWVYPGAVTFTLQHMVDLAREQDLVVKPLDWPHPTHVTWIAMVNPENESAIPDLNSTRTLRLEHELRFYRQALSVPLKVGFKIALFLLRVKHWRW